MTRLLTLVALLLAFAAGPGAAATLAQGDNTTSAVAINTEDGSSVFEFAFEVRQTMKDVVDQTNQAVAYANCAECSTVAISFQIVLAGGDPSTVTPTNLAVAVNEQCSSCLTAAFAYQFVVAGDGPLVFTREGRRRLALIRKRLRALEDQDLTLEQLKAALDAAAAEIRDILKHDLVRVRRWRYDDHADEQDQHHRQADQPGPYDDPTDPAPAPSPQPTFDPDAVTTVTPTPTATPTPTETATPEPTTTATPTATP